MKISAFALGLMAVALPAHAADRIFMTHPFLVLTPAEDFTSSVTAGDFDGDGAIDILEANGRHWRQSNRIIFNSGEGWLDRSLLIGGHEARSYQLVAGDFDGDGDLDAIEATDNGGAWFYRNLGDGSFAVEKTPAGPTSSRSAVAFDADKDGDLDVFLSNRGEAGLLLLNNGKGKFKAIRVETSESGSVGSAAGDFNGDGADDLLLAVRDGDSALVLFNDGKGGFAERKTFGFTGMDIRCVAAGDLNKDGNTDIVYGVIGGQSVIIFGDGEGGVLGQARFGPADSEAYGLALGDLDGDGDVDIAMARSEQVNLVFFNDGNGETFEEIVLEENPWTEPEKGESPSDSYAVTIADINMDGFGDLIVANSGGANPVYLNRPASDE
ncbi:FG-GAP repeat domain-containing protein [Hyphococcus sp.]|uniref:FG-GAP repeat domain-containing protein n=1 Tax=Hyphococcus sp. TaxID=2038636 RepID=UPI003D0C2822